ncbi:hypothetical protein ANOM_003174, partial [Aspergillus nomiae NRRL 13137]
LYWGLYLIALIFMTLRIISRISIRERLKADDYFAFSSFALLSVGTAIHTAAVSPYIDAFNVAQNSTDFGHALSESSVLREDVTVVLRYSFASLIIFWLTVWEPGKLYGTTALDTLSDVMIVILPTRHLFELPATKKQKAGLVGIFALGWIIVTLPFSPLLQNYRRDQCLTKHQIASSLVRAIHASTAGNNILGPINQVWSLISRSYMIFWRSAIIQANMWLRIALACNLEPCGMCCWLVLSSSRETAILMVISGDRGLSSANMGGLSETLEEST